MGYNDPIPRVVCKEHACTMYVYMYVIMSYGIYNLSACVQRLCTSGIQLDTEQLPLLLYGHPIYSVQWYI